MVMATPRSTVGFFNIRNGYIEDQKLNMQKIFSDVRFIYDLHPKNK